MHSCRVVLVRPHFPGNLGAVARVMHNFGLSKLILVDPIAKPSDQNARQLATHAEFILDRAAIVPDLATALADCVLAAATSAKVEGVVRETGAGNVRDLMPRLTAAMSHGPVA